MGSKRKTGVCDLPSSSEEDEGSVRRKRPVLKTFRIYSNEYVTSSNRHEKKRAAVKIELNVNTTEGEIREFLIGELPQLRDKRFTFFTKDEAGKWYFCPCSLKCEGKDHSAEWNGRNIPRAAKSNRTVYILIESTTVEETRSGGTQTDTPTNPVPGDSQLLVSVGQYSSNPLNQKEGSVSQSVSCPDLSLSGLEHQENTSVQLLSANHGNDLNQWPTQLTQPPQEQTVSEPEYEKVKDGGGVTEEKESEGEGRIEISDEEMQTDTWNNDVASASENVSPQMSFESGYDTIPPENNTRLPVNPANSMEDEELRNFFVNGSPLLDQDTNFNSNALLSTPTEFMENYQEYHRPQTTIEKIVPKRGDVAGGEPFYLSFVDVCADHDFQVQFGPATIPVERCGDKVFEGKVPSSSTDGVVEVYLVDYLLRSISNSVHFEYTDQKKAKEDFVEKDIKTLEDLQKMFLLLCTKMSKMNLTSNDTEDAKGTNPSGGVKSQALSLFYMIASTAAKLNAMDFFRIIFSTQVGHSVFKSCKDAQTPLEEIARGNGHEELARLLEQKHSMYQDDENESDDEVDWNELARAIEKYQTLKGETAEKKSIPSTSSSEQIQGYLGDGESSTSLLSLHLSDVEGCTENTFEDQQTTQESMCGEEPDTYQSTAAEGCPQDTLEEQQTIPKSRCREDPNTCQTSEGCPERTCEEPDTCQTIAAEGCPEDTLEEQQTIPKSRCREKPDTCQTRGRIARVLIQDGMSDTDIVNTLSSSDQLRMDKAHQIKESQSSIGEKNLLANLHLNPLHIAGSGPIMDRFAPKEVASLRRKLGPFDATKVYPSTLYLDRDQTIYNLMERLDTFRALDVLGELDQQDLTGGLKAQKGSKHQETAEKELCDVKGKGATVMKTESIASLYSPLHSKVESGVEIATLAGSASSISLEEQSTEEEISQRARYFGDHLFKERFFKASKKERKSVCLSFSRTKRCALVLLLTSLLLCLVLLAFLLISRGPEKEDKPLYGSPVQPINTCNSETQFLVEHDGGSTSCEECPPCPPGQTLSTECGKRILSSTNVTCVPCKLGMSFSSKHGTSVCTPCSSCAKDQVVLQNCTLTHDIKCDKRCYGKDRYYDDDMNDCFPCVKCCQDEKDVVENECKEKLGTGSNMICSHSSINRCDKSTPPPTAQPSHHVSQTKTTKHRDVLIAVSIYVPLCIIIIITAVCLYIRKARLTGCYSWCNCNTETDEMEDSAYSTWRWHCKPTKEILDMFEKGLEQTNEVNRGILPSESRGPMLGKGTQEEIPRSCQQESKLLSSLLDDEPYLQAISERLDTTLARAGNYRAVARYYGLNHYTISSALEKNDRGATRALIERLAATDTNLTVQEFAAVVRQKAKREDVAELLEAYDSGKKLGDV